MQDSTLSSDEEGWRRSSGTGTWNPTYLRVDFGVSARSALMRAAAILSPKEFHSDGGAARGDVVPQRAGAVRSGLMIVSAGRAWKQSEARIQVWTRRSEAGRACGRCASVANFRSKCTHGTSPRQSQCALQVSPRRPGAVQVMRMEQSCRLNGRQQIEAPAHNGAAPV